MDGATPVDIRDELLAHIAKTGILPPQLTDTIRRYEEFPAWQNTADMHGRRRMTNTPLNSKESQDA